MESQQRKPYERPSVRPSTPQEIESCERERDTLPANELPTFVCNGCSRELPGSELAPTKVVVDDDFGLGNLCDECAAVVR